MPETIIVSGLYSGPSPSAGLGVARWLRAAFPKARLTGVDYWAGSSGLHHDVFDEIALKPSWDDIDPQLYAGEVKSELESGAFWISTIDLEVAWLARAVGAQTGLLIPTEKALHATRKPRPKIVEVLQLRAPASIDLGAPDELVYEFCRTHSWRVWVKGPYHEAVPVRQWRELEAVRTALGDRWRTDRLSLQSHVRGFEESVCFAAVDGSIADAIYMRKRIITPEGKTWAGRVGDVPADLMDRVEAAARATGWTGGAEIELLRDVDGGLWFLEWNPRFPAWIYGAALANRNLPAALVRRALGMPDAPRGTAAHPEFTRVVVEVPVRGDLPLPLPAEPDHGQVAAHGKYGAELSAIVPMLAESGAGSTAPPLPPGPEIDADLRDAVKTLETPRRMFLTRTAEALFARVAPADVAGISLRYAYSVKTCPDAEYLRLALRAGMMAECISLLEVRRALETGWTPDGIVLNGPGKNWPPTEPAVDGLRAVFCDSVEELDRLNASGRRDALWGVRLRLPGFQSRFGVPVDDPEAFERLCVAVEAMPAGRKFGVHVHMASTLVGIGHWRDAVESAVVWASLLQSVTGRPVQTLDLGGGYHPGDFFRIPFPAVVEFAMASLPALREVYVEPGRALTQSTMAIVTGVLDVRRRGGRIDEVVVDTCIADLPLAANYPHRVFRMDGGKPAPVGRGAVRVVGRICMEDDILSSGLDLPENLKVGDRLVICDAGAYERSMSYAFGCGGYI